MNIPAEKNNHMWTHNFNDQRNVVYMFHNGYLSNNQQINKSSQQINYQTNNNQHQKAACDNVTRPAAPLQNPRVTFQGPGGNSCHRNAPSHSQMQGPSRVAPPSRGHNGRAAYIHYSTPMHNKQSGQHVGPTTQQAMFRQPFIIPLTSHGQAPVSSSTAPSSSHNIQMSVLSRQPNSSVTAVSRSVKPPTYVESLVHSYINSKAAEGFSFGRNINQIPQPNPKQHVIVLSPPKDNAFAPNTTRNQTSCRGCSRANYQSNLSANSPLLNVAGDRIAMVQMNASIHQDGPTTPLGKIQSNGTCEVSKNLPKELSTNERCLSSTTGHMNKVVAVVLPMSIVDNQPTISEADSPNFDQIKKPQMLNWHQQRPELANQDSINQPVDKSVCVDDIVVVTPTKDVAVPVTPTEERPELKDGVHKDNISNAEFCELLKTTTAWTAEALGKLLESQEEPKNPPECPNISQKIIEKFWGGSLRTVVEFLKESHYVNLLTEAHEFCSEQVTPDTVICVDCLYSQRFRVLEENEAYKEAPYTSSWLNTNENLDDIDKEFGFPPKLCSQLNKEEVAKEPNSSSKLCSQLNKEEVAKEPNSSSKLCSQLNKEEVAKEPNSSSKLCSQLNKEEVAKEPNSSSVDIPSETLLQSELQNQERSSDENVSVVETDCVEMTDLPDAGCLEESSEFIDATDTDYSLCIEVMSPSAAKALYHQNFCTKPQTPERESEQVGSVKENEPTKCTDVLTIIDLCDDVELVEEKEPQMDQVCCVEKWKQIFTDGSTCTCDCKSRKEKEAGHKNKAVEGSDGVLSLDWSELADVIDITDSIEIEDDDRPKPQELAKEFSEAEPQMDVASCEVVQTNSLDHVPDSPSSDVRITAVFGGVDVDIFGQISTTGMPFEVAPVPLQCDTPEKDHTFETAVCDVQKAVKRKRSDMDESLPFSKTLECLSKRVQKISQLRNMDTEEPSANETKTAQLVLFGSQSTDNCVGDDDVERFTDAEKPPNVVLVKFQKKYKQSLKVQRSERSPEKVEKCLKELKKTTRLSKDSPERNNTEKQSPTRLVLDATVVSGNNQTDKEQSNASHGKSQRTYDADFYTCERRLKKAEKRLKRLKKKAARRNSLKRADKMITSPRLVGAQESGSGPASPVRTHVLKFSVLPETFSFNDGSSATKDSQTNNKVGYNSNEEKQDKRVTLTLENKAGTWCLENKKTKPPCPSTKSGSLFNKYKRKQ